MVTQLQVDNFITLRLPYDYLTITLRLPYDYLICNQLYEAIVFVPIYIR